MVYVINGKKKKKWKGGINKNVFFSEYPGHAVEIVRNLIKEGKDEIVAVGGDGTFNEVINGCFEEGKLLNESIKVYLLFLGSSGDTLKSLKEPIRADVIKLVWKDREKYAINMVNMGIGGLVAEFAYSLTVLKGKLKYEVSTLYSFIRYKGEVVSLEVDGNYIGKFKILNLAVANGEFTGGGMWMAPGARMDDGIMEIVVIEAMSTVEFLKKLPILYSGDIYKDEKVHHFRGKYVKIGGVSAVEADGEPQGYSPLSIEIIPQAINLLPYG